MSCAVVEPEVLATGTATVDEPTTVDEVQRAREDSDRFYEAGSDAISRALSRESETFLRQARQEAGQ